MAVLKGSCRPKRRLHVGQGVAFLPLLLPLHLLNLPVRSESGRSLRTRGAKAGGWGMWGRGRRHGAEPGPQAGSLGEPICRAASRGRGLWWEKKPDSTTLTFCSLCLQFAMSKRLQARRLDGIDHNPW